MPRFNIATSAPSKTNKNYISIKNGGLNWCIRPQDYSDGKSYFNGSVLSNCVGWANGRFNEIYNEITVRVGCEHKYPYLNCNAENFITRAKKQYPELKIVNRPTLGGIMVWAKGKVGVKEDGCGHVGIVERIDSANEIFTSESDYGYTPYFKNRVKCNDNGRWGLTKGFSFLGCIVNPAMGDVCLMDEDRDETVNQILVKSETTKVYDEINGCFIGYASKGYLTYEELVCVNNKKWYRLDEDHYVEHNSTIQDLPVETYKKPEPVEKDTTKDQLYVPVYNLRIRKEPSTSSQKMGMFDMGYYDVLEVSKKSDYTWYKLGKNSWAAGVPQVTYYPKKQKKTKILKTFKV